ncbi:MAG: copper amine oxidase N-terminal domain-containing protein [Armatimonadetes bacterium]|nr:copper amine oxidase N-terminal domain-containing protein [Armatimonadota bacterium]MDW8028850.1 hypothetical protein [Armatimonadota bacterium]
MHMVSLVLLSLATFAFMSTIRINLLEGQPMDEEQAMKLMKEFVALEPNEVPGFDTKGGVISRTATKWGVMSLDLLQRLRRTGTGIPGLDPTDIVIKAFLLPNRDIAYQAAVLLTTSQRIYPDGAGMPQGSWTGLPIGEKSWATVAKAEKPGPGLGSSVLVVWDKKIALRVEVHYQPIDPKAKTAIFLPVQDEDLELGELAARLILIKANLVLLGWRDLPKVRLVANRRTFEAKKTKDGLILAPAKALLEGLGEKAERKLGIFSASWKGKKIILPIGSRVMLVGKERYPLSLPILFEGGEAWIDGAGLAKGLGLALRWEKGQLVLAKR